MIRGYAVKLHDANGFVSVYNDQDMYNVSDAFDTERAAQLGAMIHAGQTLEWSKKSAEGRMRAYIIDGAAYYEVRPLFY